MLCVGLQNIGPLGLLSIIVCIVLILLINLCGRKRRHSAESHKVCASCGGENDVSAVFCKSCGSRLGGK